MEDEQIAAFVASIRTKTIKTPEASGDKLLRQGSGQASINLSLPEGYEMMSDQELAVWYNDGSTGSPQAL